MHTEYIDHMENALSVVNLQSSKQSVTLMDHMGSDLTIVNAARVSFDKMSEELTESDKKLIAYLAKHRHMTPFRHSQVQIRCKAPIFIARQLGKHQAGLSWNEVSRRYVDFEPEIHIPNEWRGRPDGSIKQGSAGLVSQLNTFEPVNKAYSDHITRSLELYDEMLKSNIAPEMARMVLPQSMMTEWVWSGNILALAHVYKERIAFEAQDEVRKFAHLLDNIIQPLYPVSWEQLTK